MNSFISYPSKILSYRFLLLLSSLKHTHTHAHTTNRHQGWNDGCSDEMTAEYERNLANLIRDLRIDLGVPNLPVSIGVSGMMGYHQQQNDAYDYDNNNSDTNNNTNTNTSSLVRPDPRRDELVAAQFAMMNASKYPEFVGTVEAVETRGYARDPAPHSPSTQVYHWNGNCESYWLVGKSMAEAMLRLMGVQQGGDDDDDKDTGGGYYLSQPRGTGLGEKKKE
jgi:hypothetical protein